MTLRLRCSPKELQGAPKTPSRRGLEASRQKGSDANRHGGIEGEGLGKQDYKIKKGRCGVHVGTLRGPFLDHFGGLGRMAGGPGGFWWTHRGLFGSPRAAFWGAWGAIWVALGPCWGLQGSLWEAFGVIWVTLGALGDHSGPLWTPLGVILEPFWHHVGSFLVKRAT